MTAERPRSIERLYELLADRATQGLSADEQSELDELLGLWPHVDPDGFDLAAAAIDRLTGEPGDMPAAVRDRILADAPAHMGVQHPGVRPGWSRPSARRVPWLALAGWATAAAILIAFLWPRPSPTPADRRDRLFADASAKAVSFRSQPGQPSAEVVWSQSRQEGYLEVRGLPPNDPAKAQYQLWVFDGTRKAQGHDRVDGGVFDVGPDGRAVVPIRAALTVFDATAFAVTEEVPGGVIVSDVPKSVRVVLTKGP